MASRRQPIERVIDLAIGLPVVTAVAARRSVPLFAQATRAGWQRIAERSGPTTGDAPHGSARPFQPVTLPEVLERELVEGTVLEGAVPDAPTTVDNALPIEDYDHLAARQVVDRLGSLSADDLDLIDVYERAHRRRRTVLGRIAQLRS